MVLVAFRLVSFRPQWLLASVLWLSSSAWSRTVLENAALLGMSHEQLFIELHGLKEKLTGVEEAHVVKGILA